MQQDNKERGRMEEEMKQQQDRRLKPMQGENEQHNQQPQKCPRCESLNTKFCYYNNYSLSQPRYFCKTCRRYWTQGGTLRNVPVGGGCRKGKRTKTSNSGNNSRSQLLPAAVPLIQQQQGQQNIGTAPAIVSMNSAVKEPLQPPPPPVMNSYYSGGGFLSSMAVIQSLNQNPQGFNQPINVGGGNFGGSSSASSNMALLQGFNVPTFSSQQQHHQHQIQQNELIFQMGNREKNAEPLFASQENWHHHQALMNTTTSTNPTPSDAGLWNINNSSSSNTTNNSNRSTVGASMNPYQWPDLPGYGPPP